MKKSTLYKQLKSLIYYTFFYINSLHTGKLVFINNQNIAFYICL